VMPGESIDRGVGHKPEFAEAGPPQIPVRLVKNMI
jgi:hypothetical protein